jgi:magnesium transporter
MAEYNFEYRYISFLDEEFRKELEEKYNIEELDIEDVFTDTQLSKIERRPNYMYVALQFPEFDKNQRHFTPKEVHCFVSKKYVLLINKNGYKHLEQFNQYRNSVFNYEPDSINMFYEMLDYCVKKTYRVVQKFKIEISQIENNIFSFENNFRDLLKEILIVKRNLIYFISIIYPLQTVIEEIQSKHIAFWDKEEGVEELDDSLDKIKKIVNNLKNFKEQMALLTETNESLTARNTNQVIKILTITNLIFLVPTIITSFFGMNVYFGWNEESQNLQDFLPLAGILVLISTTTLGTIFVLKKARLF